MHEEPQPRSTLVLDAGSRAGPLEELVEGWLRQGLISADQAAAMLGTAPSAARPPP